MKSNTITAIAKGVAISALFLIPLFPLIVANSLFFPFIVGKALYFRVLVEVAFAAWVVLCFLDAKYRPKMSPVTIAVSVFALITLGADLIGVNPLRSLWSNFERMEGWITIAHLWAFYMASTYTFGVGEQGRRLWRMWLNASVVVAVFVAGYALAQHFGIFGVAKEDRIESTLGNAAYLAVYMLWNIGFSIYMCGFLHSRRIANSSLYWVYGVLSVFFAYILYESGTRGTILGLVGGTLVGLVLYAIFAKRNDNTARYVAISIIGAIVILGGIFWMNKDSKFVQNNPTLSRFAQLSWKDVQSQGRAYIWPMAIKGVTQSPHTVIAGWGQENFNYIFNANYNPKMWNQEQWFDRAHSVFLDWLVASGLLGLLAYLSLYAALLWALWKSDLTVAKKSILTGVLAGYAIHNLVVFDNIASYVMFFAALGFVGSLKEYPSFKLIGEATPNLDTVEYVVAPVVIVLLVGGLYFLNLRVYNANAALLSGLQSCQIAQQYQGQVPDITLFQKALDIHSYVANQETREQLLPCAAGVIGGNFPGPTKQSFYTLASSAIENQIAATPKDARMYTLGGSFYDQTGNYTKSIELLQKALSLSPNKQSTMLELALAEVYSNKTDQAIDLLAKAYALDASDGEVKTAYASVLVIAGKDDQAHKLFGNDPSIFQTEQMAKIYMSKKQYDQAIAIYQALSDKAPTDVNAKATLSQAQFAAGRVSAAVKTMQSIVKDHPEYTDQVEAAIKQMQK